MLVSARRAISYPNPDRSDRPDIPAHVLNLVNALEVDMIYAQGTDAARVGRAHLVGTLFYCTDTTLSWYDDGATWHQVGTTAAGINLSGTYLARPAIGTVAAGTTYFATDTLGQWMAIGGVWVLIDQGCPLITAAQLAAAPFTTPYDGQIINLQADAANGINWQFRWNAGSGSAYKWESLAQSAPLYSEIVTAESTGTGGYNWVSLTTVGPQVTVPRAGDYDYEISAGGGNGSYVNDICLAIGGAIGAFTGPGASTNDPGSCYLAASGIAGTKTRRRRATAVASSSVLSVRYGQGTTGVPYMWRTLHVWPVRIS